MYQQLQREFERKQKQNKCIILETEKFEIYMITSVSTEKTKSLLIQTVFKLLVYYWKILEWKA